jgi:hypothetical protein
MPSPYSVLDLACYVSPTLPEVFECTSGIDCWAGHARSRKRSQAISVMRAINLARSSGLTYVRSTQRGGMKIDHNGSRLMRESTCRPVIQKPASRRNPLSDSHFLAIRLGHNLKRGERCKIITFISNVAC